MADPQTTTIQLFIPTLGSDVGSWNLPINGNSAAIDTLFGNLFTIGLTNANVTLTTPPNSGASWSGPYSSQCTTLVLTGTLTGNCIVTLPRAGFWFIDNQCVVGVFFIQFRAVGTGNVICVPPGEVTHILCDGTNVKYVNLGRVGSALDLHNATGLPPWISACTILPYLIKDGSIYNFSSYPALGVLLGSTFGGNGITTFGVPDERARMRVAYDTGATNRITTAVSGMNGATMGSAGGNQSMQQHNHTASTTDPGHNHTYSAFITQQQTGSGGAGFFLSNTATGTTSTSTTGITVQIANTGAGTSQNMPPAIVDFLPLIKT